MKKSFVLLLVLCCTARFFSQNTVKVTPLSSGGPPMIFLPHIGCSSDMWKDIASYYSKSYSCYLVDFAGFDTLRPLQGGSYTEAYVRDLTRYLKDHHLKNSILVGQNYGVFVAVKMTLDKSLRIKALIASDFYPKLSMVIDTSLTREKLEVIQTSIRKVMMESDSATFAATQKQTAEMMNFVDTAYVKSFVRWQMQSDRKTLAETLCEQLRGDLLPFLERNKCPILVFSTWYFAKTYKQLPISEAHKHLARMYGKTPLVTHAITDCAKDFMANDQPEWFKGEMNTFLKQQHLGK